MRDRYDEFERRGAGVAAVGMGWPELAAGFKEQFDIPFPVLVDRTRESYRALGIRRGSLMDVIGPKVWLPWAKSMLSGTGQTLTKVDQLQLGGAIVVAPGGKVLLQHAASDSADNVPVDEILRALP